MGKKHLQLLRLSEVIDVCTGIKGLMERLEFRVNEKGEEEADMCKALKEIVKDAEKQGMKQGVKQGMKQGVKQGENLLGTLIDRLLADERTEDARLAAVDETARNRLYRDYGILNS